MLVSQEVKKRASLILEEMLWVWDYIRTYVSLSFDRQAGLA